MEEVVRPASDDDCAELDRLQALAREGAREVRGGALRLLECNPVTEWSSLMADPDSLVLVGTLDGVVVSYLTMLLSASLDRAIISQVYVEVEGRGLGLGDGMVEAAVAAAKAAGLSGIEAVALPGDRETKNLFERAGLTARKLTVYKDLG